jgi:outer membrane lipoprotein carrier protein
MGMKRTSPKYRDSLVAAALCWAFACAVLATCPVAMAEVESDAERRLAGLQRWLDATVDLSGRFEQELLSGALGTGIEERGEFSLVRPGKLRFDYLEPERKIAIVNGSSTVFWVEEEDQTTFGELAAEDDLLSVLLIGDRPLVELFRASIDLEPVARGRYRLRLVPLEEGQTLTELILTLREKGDALEAVQVLDISGNRMLYRFPKLQRNHGIPSDRFLWKQAPGE